MAMRDPETARLLRAVSVAVADAREGGCAARACIWDATVAAVDGEYREHASPEARRTADGACRAVDPPTVKAGPRPPDPPRLARWLLRLGNALASRKARHGA
jgi:hypothetical protein